MAVNGELGERHVEVCIVGAGLAGLCAAVRASQLGAKVLVLEQGSENDYPCNSRYAGGMMHLAFEDISLQADVLADRLVAKAPPDLNLALIGAIGRNSRTTLEWLIDTAHARFVRAGGEPWQKWCLAPIRPRRPGLVWPGRGPDMLLRNLTRAFSGAGGEIIHGARVSGVNKGTAGYEVTCDSEDRQDAISCRALVVADGGFQADRKRVAETVAASPETVLDRNAFTGSGIGMRLAQKMEAMTSQVHRFYGHLVSADALTNTKLWPWPTLDELAVAGLLVNKSGKLFADASLGGVHLANQVARSREPAFVVIDEHIWRTVGVKSRIVPCNPFLERAGATIFKSEDLLEAVRSAGIDTDEFLQGLDTRASALSTPPFRVIPVAAGITYTMSGLEVTADMAVKAAVSGDTISGLFAAGSTVGGAEGAESTFYLGGLAKAAITGRIAGASAARSVAGQSLQTPA